MSVVYVDILKQIGFASLYYGGLILIVRLAGKRLAGQTTSFDLIVLISLGVTLQSLTLQSGATNTAVFIVTVLSLHIFSARLSQKYPLVRRLLREQPRPLVREGQVMYHVLREEGLTEEELLAALRKMGFASAAGVKLAVLEETGHITAIKNESS